MYSHSRRFEESLDGEIEFDTDDATTRQRYDIEEDEQEGDREGVQGRSAPSSTMPGSLYGSYASHPSFESMSPAEALRLTQSHGQLLLLNLPSRTQFGIDYWSFVVGEEFKGMKMIPKGVHFIWTAPATNIPATKNSDSSEILPPPTPAMITDPDMMPRIGTFIWFESNTIYVQRWSHELEALAFFDDPAEEERYRIGARRHDFDRGQGTYPLKDKMKWLQLTNYITEQLVRRIEPVDRLIGVGKSKYTLDDKRIETSTATATGATTVSESSTSDVAMKDNMNEISPSSAALPSSTSTTAPTQSSVSNPSRTSGPSSSFYTRIPTVSSIIGSGVNNPDEDASTRAARITALHIDQSPILEHILAHSSATPLLDGDDDSKFGPLRPSERDLLGEIQLSFVAFLVGQDYEGFEAWKGLTVLLTSCVEAIHTHHVLFEHWVGILSIELNSLPKDFFVDAISGENFLYPSLIRFFAAASEAVVPTSLLYACKELQQKLQDRFMWKFKPMPEFKHREELLTEGDNANDSTMDVDQRMKELQKQMQLEAEEDEYAPTIVE